MKSLVATVRSPLAIAALGLAGLAAANAQSYDFWFNTPIEVDSLQLGPGPYNVTQDGSSVVFKNASTGTVYMVRATVEHSAEKNSTLKVQVVDRDGHSRLQAIELAGTTTDLEFGD